MVESELGLIPQKSWEVKQFRRMFPLNFDRQAKTTKVGQMVRSTIALGEYPY